MLIFSTICNKVDPIEDSSTQYCINIKFFNSELLSYRETSVIIVLGMIMMHILVKCKFILTRILAKIQYPGKETIIIICHSLEIQGYQSMIKQIEIKQWILNNIWYS